MIDNHRAKILLVRIGEMIIRTPEGIWDAGEVVYRVAQIGNSPGYLSHEEVRAVWDTLRSYGRVPVLTRQDILQAWEERVVPAHFPSVQGLEWIRDTLIGIVLTRGG